MIDMHVHTNYSDGINSVEEVFELANKLNISILSITDHNSISAYEEILKNNLINKYRFSLITGTELKCHIDNEIIELLVYDFDIFKMKEFIINNYKDWEFINRNMTKEFENVLIRQNLSYDINLFKTHDFTKYNGIMELYKTVLENENNYKILDKELYKNIPEFFRKCVCNENSKYYVNLTKYYPSVEDIFDFARNNNCKVFMPHVFLFSNGLNILKRIQNKYRIDGVECYHPSYTLDECIELLDYCNINDLYISAGSDYHGNGYMLGSTNNVFSNDRTRLFEFKNAINRK